MPTYHIEWSPALQYSKDELKKLEYCGINLTATSEGFTMADISNQRVYQQIAEQWDKGPVSIYTLDSIFKATMDNVPVFKPEVKEAVEDEPEEIDL